MEMACSWHGWQRQATATEIRQSSMLRTDRCFCCSLQGRRSAVVRLEACSSGGGKGTPARRLPRPWAALLAQLTAASQTRMHLDAMAADAADISNGDPVLQVRQAHALAVLMMLLLWQSGYARPMAARQRTPLL